jgi:hypothetical protein
MPLITALRKLWGRRIASSRPAGLHSETQSKKSQIKEKKKALIEGPSSCPALDWTPRLGDWNEDASLKGDLHPQVHTSQAWPVHMTTHSGPKTTKIVSAGRKLDYVFVSDHFPSSVGPAKWPQVKRGQAPAGPAPIMTALGFINTQPSPVSMQGRKPSHWPVFQPGFFFLRSGADGCHSGVKSCLGTREWAASELCTQRLCRSLSLGISWHSPLIS